VDNSCQASAGRPGHRPASYLGDGRRWQRVFLAYEEEKDAAGYLQKRTGKLVRVHADGTVEPVLTLGSLELSSGDWDAGVAVSPNGRALVSWIDEQRYVHIMSGESAGGSWSKTVVSPSPSGNNEMQVLLDDAGDALIATMRTGLAEVSGPRCEGSDNAPIEAIEKRTGAPGPRGSRCRRAGSVRWRWPQTAMSWS
jgi:hypothetical protein